MVRAGPSRCLVFAIPILMVRAVRLMRHEKFHLWMRERKGPALEAQIVRRGAQHPDSGTGQSESVAQHPMRSRADAP